MSLSVKEIRMNTGFSQKKFADLFKIPVSTLRKWEQGESTPPAYLVDLIADSLPSMDQTLEIIEGRNEALYYYDSAKNQLTDRMGNAILIREDLKGVNRENLKLYVSDLFESLYEIQNKFEHDCYYDKQDNIVWTD